MYLLRTLTGALALILASSLVVGCASPRSQNAAGRDSGGGIKDIQSFHLSDPEGPKVVDVEFENIPSEVNPMVENWINYFMGRGRPNMERYLSRSTRYEKLMKKVLRDNGLPEDIFYIALIESGFSSRAVSHASAVGYWQFIRGTGKRYGLKMDRFIDERRDPVLATQAAADYFKGLYSVFGSWYLAMASYNVGENRVKREVMNHYTRDFWELAKKNRFPRETINYIPKFLAAKIIAKNPEKYGFGDIDYMPPIEFDSITLSKPVNLRVMAEKMNINYEDFKDLNPKFKGEIAPLAGKSLDLRIPVGQRDIALAAAEQATVNRVEYIADSGDTKTYRIVRGDTLSGIARKYRTTVAYLRDLNDIPKRKLLRIGMRIQVPDRTPVRSRTARSSRKSASSSLVSVGGTKYYIVQRGDSLFTIAKRYKTTVSKLQKINNIRRGKLLRVGVKLKIPSDGYSPEQSRVKRKARRVVRHKVRRGENLHIIAAKYNVDVKDIKRKNKIKNPSLLYVGSSLLIPVARASK